MDRTWIRIEALESNADKNPKKANETRSTEHPSQTALHSLILQEMSFPLSGVQGILLRSGSRVRCHVLMIACWESGAPGLPAHTAAPANKCRASKPAPVSFSHLQESVRHYFSQITWQIPQQGEMNPNLNLWQPRLALNMQHQVWK